MQGGNLFDVTVSDAVETSNDHEKNEYCASSQLLTPLLVPLGVFL